ncbi:restriction endonuclease subunit S [Microcoleus sp. MON1_C1]|uniref:restriction endonuclease subunit S n=1 Tax=Microcoleus sp. MON1_C1 TaxID=2818827 RepID=UPI002FD4DE89
MTSKQLLFNRPVPQGWQMLTVDEIKANEPRSCVAGPFGSSISSKYFVPEGVPVIRGNNLSDNLKPFVPHGFAFVSEEKAESFKAQQVKGGDLVFTCWGTLGQVALIPKKGPYSTYIISNKQLKLRPNLEICDARFLFYYFASPQMVQHIRSIAIGAAVPGINLGILKSLQVVIPPLPIQRKIAAILSAYDDLIENNTRRMEILEEMARSIYREWFVNFRFPGNEQVQMVDSELGLIPEGWEVKKLEKVADINASTIKPSNALEEINYIDISSVSTGKIDKIEPIALSNASSRARRIVKQGDIIWSTVRPNRKSYSLILNPIPNLIVSTGFAVVTPKKAPYTYLYHALTTDNFVGYLTNNATGSAYPAVNTGDFKNADVLIPRIELMNKFHNIVADIFNEKDNFLRKNINLRQTRDLLLPRLISGEIDVENLDINTGQIAA